MDVTTRFKPSMCNMNQSSCALDRKLRTKYVFCPAVFRIKYLSCCFIFEAMADIIPIASIIARLQVDSMLTERVLPFNFGNGIGLEQKVITSS